MRDVSQHGSHATGRAVAMLLVLLLLAHARADWVEITQLRTPPRTHHLSDTIEFHDDTHTPSFSTPSVDNGLRTKPGTREPEHVVFYDENRSKPPYSNEPSLNDGRRKPQSSADYGSYGEKSEPQVSPAPNDFYDGKIFKPDFPTEPFDFHEEKIIKPQISTPVDFYKEKRLPIQFSTEPGFLADYKRNRIYINHSMEHSSEKQWSKGVVHRVHNPTISVKRVYLTTEEPANVKYEETDLAHELTQGYTMRDPFETFEDRKPEFVTKEETFEDDDEDEVHFVRKPPQDIWANVNEIKPKNYPKNRDPIRRVDIETINPITNKTPGKTSEDKTYTKGSTESDDKANTMENMLKFVKVVADTISSNTRRSVGSKLRYLEDLKDTIMVNIEDRIESLWPDDSDAGGGTARRRRWARSAQARGHVEFPSSESALMTISFLTFAVYLIKLVLQVIQTYKNKTMMVTPAVFAAVGRAASGKPSSQ